MALEQITGENLSEIKGLRKFSRSDADAMLKFVLLKSLDQKGYVRIDYGPEHIHTLGRLHDYLAGQGETLQSFIKCGGGLVDLYRQYNEGKNRLRFYGSSSVLGVFDKDLLERTLNEALDKKNFEFLISKDI